MTLLTTVQDAADLLGLPRPAVVATSNDLQVRHLLALAQAEGKSLAARFPWTALQRSVTFTTTAGEDQGALDTLMPGYGHMVNRSQWDQSKRWPLGGPVSPQYWSQMKSVTALGPFYSFRIEGGHFKLIPAPATGGETIGVEYVTRNFCKAQDATEQDRWKADTDAGLLDEWLTTLGLVWRYKQSKGLDYAEDMQSYERAVLDALSRDGGRRTLDLAQSEGERFPPRVTAPEGSWPL